MLCYSYFVYTTSHFYATKRVCSRWQHDLSWLRDESWGGLETTCIPELFADISNCPRAFHPVHSAVPIVGARRSELAREAALVLERAALETEFSVLSGEYTFNLRNVVGFTARESWLNDAVIQYSCELIRAPVPDAKFISSLAFAMSGVAIPTTPISLIKFLVHPVHIEMNHWGVIIVMVQYPNLIAVHFYEPLCRPRYRPVLQDVWASKVMPFMRRWHECSTLLQNFPLVVEKWTLLPKQVDGSSRGMMVIAARNCAGLHMVRRSH